jgi:hypothetical protein
MLETYHQKIKIFQGQKTASHLLSEWLTKLQLLIAARDSAKILDHLSILVPEYAAQKSLDQRNAAAEAAPDQPAVPSRTHSAVAIK